MKEMNNIQERKKIMLLVPMLHQGGFERICAMTAKLLNQKHDVHVVIFSSKDMIYDVTGVDLIDLNLGAVPGKVGKLINICKRVSRVRSLKKKLGIQITYSFGTTANLVNVLTKTQDKVWVGIRGYGALEEHLQFIAGRADRVVSCTKVMEDDIAKLVQVKSSATLYNPCDVMSLQQLAQEEMDEKFQPFFQKSGKTVVSMGREDDLKGFWHLIKSVYLAKKQIPDLKLMIIGEGTYTEYKELAKTLQMEQDVLFTGVLKNPFPLLKQADVYALTSDSEGFPNALIEAMAVGVPCISANCKTGPAEILQKEYQNYDNQSVVYKDGFGILTPIFRGEKDLTPLNFTEEEQIFANEIVAFLVNEETANEYAKRAYQRAQDFSVESYVTNLEALIQEDAK